MEKKMDVIPLTLPQANRFIERHHRHHGPLPGGFAWWAVGAVLEGTVVGVALAGRPTNRNNDDGQTVEVQRVATDGSFNACSALYGACARAAKAIGAAQIITYTLDSETGASLRGVGWDRETDGITSWWTHPGTRTPAVDRDHMRETKVRWAKHFRSPLHLNVDLADKPSAQLSLETADVEVGGETQASTREGFDPTSHASVSTVDLSAGNRRVAS